MRHTTVRRYRERALIDAVLVGDSGAVSTLLAGGVRADARDREHGETALMLAASQNRLDPVRALLDAGADVDARDEFRRTPLFFARIGSATWNELLARGASPMVRDNDGNTILHRAVARAETVETLRVLLDLEIDPQAVNHDGETALDIAREMGLTHAVAALTPKTV